MDGVVHFEIPAQDLDRARNFYASIFGWKLTEMPMGDGESYVILHTTEVDEKNMPKNPGAINGGMMKISSAAKNPVVVINVPSIDERIGQIEAAGGKLVAPKMTVMDMGYYAYVEDTEGNVIGIWENMKKSE